MVLQVLGAGIFPDAFGRDEGANIVGKARGVKSQEHSGTWRSWWEEDRARYKGCAGEVQPR